MDFIFNYFDPNVILSLKITCSAVVLDALAGMLIALFRGEFNIRLVPKFLESNAPFIAFPLLFAIWSVWDPAMIPIVYGLSAIITAKFGTEALKDKIYGFITERLNGTNGKA